MKFIPNSVSTKVARQVLVAQKNSPKMLFASGIAGIGVSTVLACRATLRLEETLAKTQHDMHVANTLEHDDYSDQDRRKDKAVILTRGVVSVAKLYAPPVLLMGASIGALTASHHILEQRNLALTAAYASVAEAFEKYRGRVIEKYGEDEDRLLRYEHEEVKFIDDKGKTVSQMRVAPGDHSMYARFFDEYSPNWSKEAEYNLMFLRMQQNYWNDMLKVRGFVMLNDVYKSLGLEPSTAGAVVGWMISKEGDNFIDFGIYDNNDAARDFVNGREGSILLDFNVDGVIYDKLDNFQREEKIAWQS